MLYRRRQDWTVAHPNIELCILTSSHPVAKTVALKFLILRPHFDMDSRLLARKRSDWTVPHSNTEHTCLTFVILSKINRYPVVKTVALFFLISRPHFDMDSTYWFLIFFWSIFEGNHFESIPKVRRACICIAEWSMLNAEWWMLNDEWWMMNDDGWWMMNDEWRMTNDEWWTIIHIHTL